MNCHNNNIDAGSNIIHEVVMQVIMHIDHSRQNIQDNSTCATIHYNMKAHHGEQHIGLYIISYCFGSINSSNYDKV